MNESYVKVLLEKQNAMFQKAGTVISQVSVSLQQGDDRKNKMYFFNQTQG